MAETPDLVLAGQKGKTIVLGPGETSGRALTLSDLANCEVVVLDVVGQVSCERLVNCRLFLAANAGSCILKHCRGSIFTMALKQFRVLESHDCTFFLMVQTDPIVEKSSALYFGAYNASHPMLPNLHTQAGLEIHGEGNWASVFDFSTGSLADAGPANWSLIEPGQGLVDVRTKGLSALGVYKLRLVFWRFDTDHDGGLSFSEVNAFQNAIGSDEVLPDASSMHENFARVGLSLDKHGHLPFSSFLELYQLQGEEELHSDLSKLGMERLLVDQFDLEPYAIDFEDGEDEDEDEDYEDSFDEDEDEGEHDPVGNSLEAFSALLAPKPGADVDFDLDLAFDGDADNNFPLTSSLHDAGMPQPPPPAPLSISRSVGLEETKLSRRHRHGAEKKGSPVATNRRRSDKRPSPISATKEAKVGRGSVRSGNGTVVRDRKENIRNKGPSDVQLEPLNDIDDEMRREMDDFDDDEWGEDWDVLSCATNLCVEAHHRGVNLQKWFANYDLEKRTSLPQSVFETAFSALLLGLCAGSSEVFVNDVQRVLDPHNLHELCAALEDHRDASFVRYMPLVLKSKARSPRRFDAMETGETSFLTQPVLAEVDGSVELHLQERFRQDSERPSSNAQPLFERVRDAVQSWKWSVGGRIPTMLHSVASVSSQRDCISERNLRNAFRASLQVDFSSTQLHEFSEMLRTTIELDVEAHARALQEHALQTSVGAESDPQVTVAALLRWLSSLRLSRAIDREAWLHSKRAGARQTTQEHMDHLMAALGGDLRAMSDLRKSPDLLQRLISQEQILPLDAIPGEAKGRAQDWLESSEGRAAIRKRALHMKIQDAEAELLEEALERETKALKEQVEPRVDLFLEFCKASESGLASGSFQDWIVRREESRKKKRRALSKWELTKRLSQPLTIGGTDYVMVASALFDKIRGLVGRTYDHLKDDTRGYAVCRSSRYAGLDADKTIAAFIKRKTDASVAEAGRKGVEELVKASTAISAGEFLITYAEFRESFESLLNSLSADPRTRDEALDLLSPVVSAHDRVEEFILTTRGKEELKEAKDKSAYRTNLRRKYEEEILLASGFRPRDEATEVLAQTQDDRRARAEANFKKWSRNKAKAKRRELKAAKAAAQEEEAVERERKAQSKRAYKQWKLAASKGKYPSYAVSSPHRKPSSSTKGTSVKKQAWNKPSEVSPSINRRREPLSVTTSHVPSPSVGKRVGRSPSRTPREENGSRTKFKPRPRVQLEERPPWDYGEDEHPSMSAFAKERGAAFVPTAPSLIPGSRFAQMSMLHVQEE
mmetsp:Transcript_6965/g.13919  ORF Transcript_6965/g.13919 Transcript_6965/m.13919 type:complete len:1287 (+) Transcript_6965:60-3920(+)